MPDLIHAAGHLPAARLTHLPAAELLREGSVEGLDAFNGLNASERLLVRGFADLLGDSRAKAQFAVRHTGYSVGQRVLHFVTFGVAYSSAAKAYNLEKRAQRTLGRAVSDLQTRLSALPAGTPAAVSVTVGKIALTVSQDAAGRLQACIAETGRTDEAVTFDLPHTAGTLVRKLVDDMVRRPDVYPRDALRNAIAADIASLRCPLRRDVYETVLRSRLGVTPDELAASGKLTLREAALRVLAGEIITRDALLAYIDDNLGFGAQLDAALTLNDEAAADLIARYEEALIADADRVRNAVDIAALTAPPPAPEAPAPLPEVPDAGSETPDVADADLLALLETVPEPDGTPEADAPGTDPGPLPEEPPAPDGLPLGDLDADLRRRELLVATEPAPSGAPVADGEAQPRPEAQAPAERHRALALSLVRSHGAVRGGDTLRLPADIVRAALLDNAEAAADLINGGDAALDALEPGLRASMLPAAAALRAAWALARPGTPATPENVRAFLAMLPDDICLQIDNAFADARDYLTPDANDAARTARIDRQHNLAADLVLNREASLYDRNLGDPAARIRATLLRHPQALADLLNDHKGALATFGSDTRTHLDAAVALLRGAWVRSGAADTPLTAADAAAFAESLPDDVCAALDGEIEALVDDLSATLGHGLAEAVETLRGDAARAAGARPAPSFRAIREAVGDAEQTRAVLNYLREPLCARVRGGDAVGDRLYALGQAETVAGCTTIPWAFALSATVREVQNVAPNGGGLTDDEIIDRLAEAFAERDDYRADGIVRLAARLSDADDAVRTATENDLASLRQAAVPKLADMMTSAFDPNKGYGKFITDVMARYFDTDLAERAVDRRSMVASLIRYSRLSETGEPPSPGALLGAAFKGAGPIMQKALQGLDASALSPELAEAIADMKSSLAPIDPAYVRAQLLDLVDRSEGAISKITVDRSLGAASVGQAFLCTVTDAQGRDTRCVLKLLRPDVRNKAARERLIFEDCARRTPGMERTFAGQLERILAELDLTDEAVNADTGRVYEKPGTAGVESMRVLEGVPRTPGALLLELAPGRDLAKIMADVDAVMALDPKTADLPVGRLMALEHQLRGLQTLHGRLLTLSDRWVSEGIFDSGFYHGDLHAGNIMADIPEDPEAAKLTVIDYGNATTLTKAQQKQVMVVMAGATYKKTDWFLDGYLKLLPPEDAAAFRAADTVLTDDDGYLVDADGIHILGADGNLLRLAEDGTLAGTRGERPEGRLTAMVRRIMNQGSMEEVAQRIAVALSRLQEHGIACPPEIFNFSACQIRLQNAVDGLGKQLDPFREQLHALAVRYLKLHRADISEADREAAMAVIRNTSDTITPRHDFIDVVGRTIYDRKGTFIHAVGLNRAIEICRMGI